MEKSNNSWSLEQVTYWDLIAKNYDNLYRSKWDVLENIQTLKQLAQILVEYDNPNILDLGCGTGLGYDFCFKLLNDNFKYTGIDISSKMVSVCKNKWNNVPFFVGDMKDLSRFPDETFDVVICLFTAFSYVDVPERAINELYRVVRNGGAIFISTLSRFSLRRLLKLKIGRVERYYTRGTNSSFTIPANTFTLSSLISMFQNRGFSDLKIQGLGVLSGVLEFSFLWEIDVYLSKRIPTFCHIISLRGKKQQRYK